MDEGRTLAESIQSDHFNFREYKRKYTNDYVISLPKLKYTIKIKFTINGQQLSLLKITLSEVPRKKINNICDNS